MAENLKKRVRSQRGASLSFALFVFLVCAMVSAAVLAAATAASGQYAKLGEYDQRYYSVTSAASLFRGSLSVGDEATYTYVEQRTGEYDERKEDDPVYESIKLVKVPTSSSEFDFLAEASELALFGQQLGRVEVDATDLGQDWLDPFQDWTTESREFTYQIEPTLTSGESNAALSAEAKVTVHNNWLVEVVVSNTLADPSDVSEQFSFYMAFQGKCNQKIRALDEELGDTVVSGEDAANTATVTEQRTTDVTWQLVQLSPGGGFASNG